ncbi:MAG: MFS transporter [Anaerolineae bacterium]
MARKSITGFRAFLVIWFGQLISLTGSGLTGFALGVWVYLTTGSTTLFALMRLVSTLPAILLGPVAGALVDRWDRRHAMIISDAGAALCTLAILLLLGSRRLELWHLYILLAIGASFGTFQWPAYSAATTLLVPKEHYGRASGLVQLADASAQIVAPAAAGVLLDLIMVEGVLMIDLAAFLLAVVTLLIVRVPRPPRSVEALAARGSLWSEAVFGWHYIRARRGLFGLLRFFLVANFGVSMILVLFTPLVLGFASPATLGILLSVTGAGFLAGSLLMGAWGGPRRLVRGIFVGEAVLALAVIAGGTTVQPVLLGVCAFVAFGAMAIVNACSQAIWQRKTAPDVQGRVFAFRRVIASAAQPAGLLLAGPLADRVFNPLLVGGGPLAGSVGRVIGVGAARGVGLLYVVLGLFVLAATAVACAYGPLRRLEDELPDAVPATAEPMPAA